MNIIFEDELDTSICVKKRNLRKSSKRRWQKKFDHSEKSYDEFLDMFLRDESNQSTHPLLLISAKDYFLLKDNIILVEKPSVIKGNTTDRKVSYKITNFGKNISFGNKGQYKSIKIRNTKKNCVLIMMHRKYLDIFQRVQIHEYINGSSAKKKIVDGKYVLLLLVVCTNNKKTENINDFDDNFLAEIKKHYPNQIRTQGKKHYKSEGWIYSVGYAAKYDKLNSKKESFSKYVKSK